MAKRFTDSDKWKKPFIRSMEAPFKLLWLYILDDCDHAGIWQVDEDVAKIKIGLDIDFKKAIKIFGDHIQVIESGEKWFIQDFIDFQYGELNPENRVHGSIITLHKKYKIKPLKRPLNGAKDKDKDKDMDEDKDKEEEAPEIPIEKFPEVLENIFSDFLDMRKKIKKPATEKAVLLLRAKLKKLSESNQGIAIQILEQSITNNWQDIYPLKEIIRKNDTGNNTPNPYEQLSAALRGNPSTTGLD